MKYRYTICNVSKMSQIMELNKNILLNYFIYMYYKLLHFLTLKRIKNFYKCLIKI
jgi:hypothetical protein